MTTRRLYYLVGFSAAVIVLFLLSYFLWAQHLVNVQAEQEIAQAEEEQKQAEEQAQLIESKLQAGNVDDENLKIVFLTFNDDSEDGTAQALEILKQNDISATFFLENDTSGDQDSLYRDIINNGHTLGLSVNGYYIDTEDEIDETEGDISEFNDYIKDLTGKDSSNVLRFVDGSDSTSQDLIDALVSLQYGYYDWNVDVGESSNILEGDEDDPSTIDEIRGQSVSVVRVDLNNPLSEDEIDDLNTLIQQLKSEGYTFKTLNPTYNISRFVEPTVDVSTTPDTNSEETTDESSDE